MGSPAAHTNSIADCIVIGTYSPPNPALKHTRTDSQSESESLPINRTSRCGNVTGNSLKYDAACSPACFQSLKAQSVGAQRLRSLCCDQADHYVGPMSMILFRREHHCRTSLGDLRAGK